MSPWPEQTRPNRSPCFKRSFWPARMHARVPRGVYRICTKKFLMFQTYWTNSFTHYMPASVTRFFRLINCLNIHHRLRELKSECPNCRIYHRVSMWKCHMVLTAVLCILCHQFCVFLTLNISLIQHKIDKLLLVLFFLFLCCFSLFTHLQEYWGG